jgi:hypothetical protein
MPVPVRAWLEKRIFTQKAVISNAGSPQRFDGIKRPLSLALPGSDGMATNGGLGTCLADNASL